eukprot:scaffold6861_cov248-Ochromonas_danica.AAC.23
MMRESINAFYSRLGWPTIWLLIFSFCLPGKVNSQKVLYTVQFGSAGQDSGIAIAVNNLSHEVYVAGEVSGPLSSDNRVFAESVNFLLLQADENSTLNSLANFPGVTDNDLIGDVLLNSSDGTLFLTGARSRFISDPPVRTYNAFLMKFAQNGSKLFFDESRSDHFDKGAGLAMDALGHVYVTGTAQGSLDSQPYYGNYDMFVMKYDALGNKLWTKQFGTSAEDVGQSLAVDSSGDIYVTGYTFGSLYDAINYGNSDLFLLKLSNLGVHAFTRVFGYQGFDRDAHLVLDSSNNIYITATVEEDLEKDNILLAKYDNNGNQLFATVTKAGSSTGIAIDSKNNLYVVGYTTDRSLGFADTLLQKYDSTGKILYRTEYGTDGDDRGLDVTVDAEDFVYISGSTSGTFQGQENRGMRDAFYMKIGNQ